MHDNFDIVVECWSTLKEYISIKDRGHAAEQVISMVMNYGFNTRDLISLADADSDLSDAYDSLLEANEIYDETTTNDDED